MAISLGQYAEEKKIEVGESVIPSGIRKRWRERIVANGWHEMGEEGAAKYLTEYGRNIGAPKVIHFARQAEAEGCPEMAQGFWRKAYELELGHTPSADDVKDEPAPVTVSIRLPHPDQLRPTWLSLFADFLDNPAAGQTTDLRIGLWGEMYLEECSSAPIVEALVAARERLPNLTTIFLGDVDREECEISWIWQSDVSPLFDAYPRLEHFRVRGSQGLSLGTLRHDHLKSLIVECGGLGANVVRQVAAAQLPALEHLELWLGTKEYGAEATVDDLAPILSGNLFPRLKYLGLRDSDIADEIAIAAARAPIVERIEVLDLSMGILQDRGAAAFLDSPVIGGLKLLDIHYHYCSEEMVEKLKLLGIGLNASDQQEPWERKGKLYRYVAVGE